MIEAKEEGFPGGSEVKASACKAGDPGSIPGSRKSPGEGNGKPPQYSCLENPMDRGTWQATVHGITRVRHDLATKQRHQNYMSSNINNHTSVNKREFVQLISSGVVGAWNKIKSEIPFYGNSLSFMIAKKPVFT